MRVLPFVLVLGLLAGCSADRSEEATARAGAGQHAPDASRSAPVSAPAARRVAGIASRPDRGQLLEYRRATGGLVRGAYTWHPVDLSEAHALRAVASGELRLRAPDGRAIRLRYDRHIEHPDGNWTWIGREPGSLPGTEAVITFGETAVFGSIPNGMKPPLRLMMADGRAWLVETDPAAVARLHGAHVRPRKPDFLVPPRLAAGQARSSATVAGMPATAAQATSAAANTVDLVLGYTSGFATRYGQPGAVTRLTYLVDLANVAYANSQVDAQLRLVRTQQVGYPDATSNEQALYDLTGVQCIQQSGGLDCEFVGVPAALQPLHDARDQYGADLVSLVRNFNDPENDGCGVAWLNGAGQVAISPSDEATGLSVVSDSGGNRYPEGEFVCREESLAHEIGHNMGSAHDRDTADGADNVLQAGEYGRYPYSFGYKTGAGGFFTVMAYGNTNQVGYRVFSNPAINYCGGQPCGLANQADNARSLRQTIPVVALFRATVVPLPGSQSMTDFDGDGRSDVLWRNDATGANAIWKSANAATQQAIAAVTNLSWKIAGTGDFDGDGRSDILWRSDATGANAIWKSGNAATPQAIASVTNLAWKVVGIGDFDGDGRSDILWRSSATGANAIWKSGNAATPQAIASVTNLSWKVAGIGDFDGDGRSDILWRSDATGANAIWKSGNAATPQAITGVTNLAWKVAGIGDFDGDGRSDILWRSDATGANAIWKSGNAATSQSIAGVANLAWKVAGIGDFDGDGQSDILWRNGATGANAIWKSGNAATPQAIASVTNLSWKVAG